MAAVASVAHRQRALNGSPGTLSFPIKNEPEGLVARTPGWCQLGSYRRAATTGARQIKQSAAIAKPTPVKTGVLIVNPAALLASTSASSQAEDEMTTPARTPATR